MRTLRTRIAMVGLLTIAAAAHAQEDVYRFDCGTPKSAVAEGYRRLAASQEYSKARGFGWEQGRPVGAEFRRPLRDPKLRGSAGQLLLEEAYDNHRNALNRDGVASRKDLGFRLDLPNGTYRVAITMGDLSQAIGSIDLTVNDALVAEQLTVWAPGGYRLLDRTPAGWWNTFRTTVNVTDGAIRITWKKNQKHYDEQMAGQAAGETPYAQWYHRVPIIQEPPYNYIGYPFVGHSVMAIEVVPYKPGPVEMVEGKLQLRWRIDSPALAEAIDRYNVGDFDSALVGLVGPGTPPEQVARAVLRLWLAGRLETEIEQEVVPGALKVLRSHTAENPGEYGLVELLSDAEIFQKAMELHRKRGQLGKNHFLENDKAIGWWLMLKPESPLYDKARLHIARAAHMLKPLSLT